jgi:hypothetical protein
LRVRAGINKGPLDKLTRAPAVAAAVLVAFAALYVLWRQRRRSPKSPTDPSAPKLDPTLETATALYRALEAALSTHGISRPASLPPLRHAEGLSEQKHPLAGEVIALTQVYLETRFGRGSLDESDKRDFERRVREIRLYRPPPPAKAQAPKGSAARPA